MAGRVSAFAILGLAPGADAAAIEAAYKRLIKLHHPDRDGGDGARAAEIIHAYRELRGGPLAVVDPLEFNEDLGLGRKSRRWQRFALLVALAIGGLVMLHGPIAPLVRKMLPAASNGLPLGHVRAAETGDTMDQPLHAAAIDGAVREALRLARTSDELALASASRDCRRQFREEPTLAQLDRCAAFDDAVVQLQDRDPLRDRGPFAQLAVTGRQWSAGSSLSDDYLAIDGRFDRIRLRVELAVAAALEPPAPPAPPPDRLALDRGDR
jgi:hypothetical protein